MSVATPELYDRTWSPAAGPTLPLRWRQPHRVLVEGDLFGPDVTLGETARALAVMAFRRFDTFLVPTESPEKAAVILDERIAWDLLLRDAFHALTGDEDAACTVINSIKGVLGEGHNVGWPMRHVVPLAIAKTQSEVDGRVPQLLRCPARYRGLWLRGLRVPIDLIGDPDADDYGPIWTEAAEQVWTDYGYETNTYPEPGISWLIVEGGDEPVHPDWLRGLRKQCAEAGVALWFESWGSWVAPEQIPNLDENDGPRIRCGTSEIYLTRRGFVSRVPGGYEPGRPCDHAPGDANLVKVGRARSGRTLDGREHTETPF